MTFTVVRGDGVDIARDSHDFLSEPLDDSVQRSVGSRVRSPVDRTAQELTVGRFGF